MLEPGGEHTEVAAAPSDSLRAVYDERARLEYAAPPKHGRLGDRKLVRMIELLSTTFPAESLLDAGCGDGRYLAALRGLPTRPERLVGVDISERILETAARTASEAGVEAQFVRANLERLPFPDASFQRVLSVQVIEHLLDPQLGVGELARVLEPGGRLVLSTDNAHAWVSGALNLPRTAAVAALRRRGRRRLVEFPHASFTCVDVERMISGAGLKVERIETFRLHLDGAKAASRATQVLARIDSSLPLGHLGDLIAAVARKP